MTSESPPSLPLNRNAVISAVAAFFTLISICVAVAPIPLTGYVCYPAGAILGLVALLTGITALAQLRNRKETGRGYALIGIGIGALALMASLCAIGASILLLPRILELLRQYLPVK